ncbi:hypothetical protein D9Q98_002771 [Chlorella vulgaris]|uniref:Rab3-GAP regulatory subunit N-terminal domain-containing protein n=1 Tax=Chlorella vulgaris TaxID=3077 RepID=A0A9D4Z021_CHLVU|nr:hypothetical protein D9Q98_002771 [Chlorella vulgaris]
MLPLHFLPKLLLQHDSSPLEVLEDVQGAFLAAVKRRAVHTSLSPSGSGLAVALGQRLVVLNLAEQRSSGGGSSAVEFVSAVEAPEAVSALVWLTAGAQSADECILAGTSAGYLQLHSAATGARLLRQPLHHSAVVGAAVRWSGCGSDPSDLSEDVSLAFADAVVRLPSWEVWAAVRWHSGQAAGGGGWWGGGGGTGSMPHDLTFSKFLLPKGAGPRTQAICLGPPPLSLYAAMAGRAGPPRVHMLTAGSSPPLASYEAEESAAPGLLSLVSDLASTTAASLLGRARSYVPGPAASAGRSLFGGLRRGAGSGSGDGSSNGGTGGDAQQQQQQQQGAAAKKREKIPGEPASLRGVVWDEQRCITQLALAPTGRLAACCDTLGRVLLVDTGSTLLVRMLKGYRDAQVAWLVCSKPEGAVNGSSGRRGGDGLMPLGGSSSSLGSLGSSLAGGVDSSADLASMSRTQANQGSESEGTSAASSPAKTPPQRKRRPYASPQQQQQQQQQQQAAPPAVQSRGRDGHLLVIYAPRRAVVELWEPLSLTRLGSVPCTTQLGMLLQQPARRNAAPAPAAHLAAAPFLPNRCLLLDATALTLTDLTASLTDLLL